MFVALFRIAACLRRYRHKKRTHNPDENCCSLCWCFHFSFEFSQAGSSEGSFEPAFTVVNHRCSESFAEMKNTLKVCLCWRFVTTVSEPTHIKTPSRATHQEAGRTRWNLPSVCAADCLYWLEFRNSSMLSRRLLINSAEEGLLKWISAPLKRRGTNKRLDVPAISQHWFNCCSDGWIQISL